MTVQECVSFLLEHDDYLLITHIRPDGDTLCSAAALCSALRRAGKTAWLYPNGEATDKYLAYMGHFFAPAGYVHKTVVTVDTAEEGMFPMGFSGTVDLAIDHHGSNSGYGKLSLLRPGYAACGELVLEITQALCGDPTQEEADLLYIAIATDTGCFQFMNTNADTHARTAELIRCGARNGELNIEFFRNVPKSRLLLDSLIYQSMRYYRGGAIAIAVITQEMLDASGVTENDMDDLASVAGKPEGVILSVTIKEKGPKLCKVSMRCRTVVNVSNICARFGGGGHSLAAGCSIEANAETAIRQILAAIDEEWPA